MALGCRTVVQWWCERHSHFFTAHASFGTTLTHTHAHMHRCTDKHIDGHETSIVITMLCCYALKNSLLKWAGFSCTNTHSTSSSSLLSPLSPLPPSNIIHGLCMNRKRCPWFNTCTKHFLNHKATTSEKNTFRAPSPRLYPQHMCATAQHTHSFPIMILDFLFHRLCSFYFHCA